VYLSLEFVIYIIFQSFRVCFNGIEKLNELFEFENKHCFKIHKQYRASPLMDWMFFARGLN
jgi:hypothetical protein